VAFVGVLVLLSSIGLGRWAYSVLLPGMQAGLKLSYAQMSFLGTSNFVGYTVAVLLSAAIVRRYRERFTVTAGLLLLSCSMIGISQCKSISALLFLFSVAGIGSGLSTIPMLSLITPWFCDNRRGRATGLLLCGNGLGITLAGYVVPQFDRMHENHGWLMSWLTFGFICLCVTVVAGSLLRNHPSEMGLSPVGSKTGEVEKRSYGNKGGSKVYLLFRLSMLFFAFGLASTIYGPFIVTSMIHEYSLSEYTAGFCWSLVGIFSFFSGIGFGYLSDKVGRRYGTVAVFSVHATAYALAGLKLGLGGLIISVILFGLSIFGAPAVLTAAVGDNTSTFELANAMAVANFLFAIGQSLGPVVAMAMAGPKGTFTNSYLGAATVSSAAALLAFTV
jgi:MFS family permease